MDMLGTRRLLVISSLKTGKLSFLSSSKLSVCLCNNSSDGIESVQQHFGMHVCMPGVIVRGRRRAKFSDFGVERASICAFFAREACFILLCVCIQRASFSLVTYHKDGERGIASNPSSPYG